MAFAVLVISHPANAATVLFDFDLDANNYTAGNANLRKADGTIWASADGNRAFSTNSMAPNGYSGPAFFGGFEVIGGGGSWDRARMTQTRIEVYYNRVGTAEMNSIFAFNVAPTALGDIDNWIGKREIFNMAIMTSLAVKIDNGQGGQWYNLSNSAALGTATGIKSWNKTDLDAEQWTPFDPATTMKFSTGGTVKLDASAVVTQMGYVVNGTWNLTAPTTEKALNILYQTKVTAVPEPAGLGLLALASLALLPRRRQRAIPLSCLT